MTRPAKKDKATQEYNFTEILAQGEHCPARSLKGWMPAVDTEGAQKAKCLPPFSPEQRHGGLLLGYPLTAFTVPREQSLKAAHCP